MKTPNYVPSFLLSLLVILFTSSLAGQTNSTLIYPGEDGKLVYVKHANTQ